MIKLRVPERAIIKAVGDYLAYMERLGRVAFFARVHAGAMQKRYTDRSGESREHWIKLARPGTPDFMGCLSDGRFFCVECKGSEGQLEREQAIVLGRVKKTGALVIVAYGVDDVEKMLEVKL